MKKKTALFLYSFFIALNSLFAQDIMLNISGECNQEKVPLDSILIDNCSNNTSLYFGNLPKQNDYQINLSKNALNGITNINLLKDNKEVTVASNIPGKLTLVCNEISATKVYIRIFNLNAQKVYETEKEIFSGETVMNVELKGSGIYMVQFQSFSKSIAFKAFGSTWVDNYSVTIDTESHASHQLKIATIQQDGDFKFLLGDILKITVVKKDYISPAYTIKASDKNNAIFIFKNNIETVENKISVLFKDPPQNISIASTPLRYNKKHAITYSQDDNLCGTVKSLLPLFSGGVPEFDTEQSPGLYISDGNGRLVTFKTNSVSWVYSASTKYWDWASKGESTYGSHVMTYNRLNTLLNNGGSLVSHEFNSLNGKDDATVAQEPNDYVMWLENLQGIRPFSFVSGGGEVFNQTLWANSWFLQGALVGVLGSGAKPSILRIDNVDFSTLTKPLQMGRVNLENLKAATMDAEVDKLMKQTGNCWLQLFSHTITDKGNFADYWQLKEFFKYVENTYGQYGSDNIWVPSISEIIQYFHTRDKIRYNPIDTSNPLIKEIVLDQSGIPKYVKQRGLTFTIKSDVDIENVMINGYSANFKKLNSKEYLIDIDLN